MHASDTLKLTCRACVLLILISGIKVGQTEVAYYAVRTVAGHQVKLRWSTYCSTHLITTPLGRNPVDDAWRSPAWDSIKIIANLRRGARYAEVSTPALTNCTLLTGGQSARNCFFATNHAEQSAQRHTTHQSADFSAGNLGPTRRPSNLYARTERLSLGISSVDPP